MSTDPPTFKAFEGKMNIGKLSEMSSSSTTSSSSNTLCQVVSKYLLEFTQNQERKYGRKRGQACPNLTMADVYCSLALVEPMLDCAGFEAVLLSRGLPNSEAISNEFGFPSSDDLFLALCDELGGSSKKPDMNANCLLDMRNILGLPQEYSKNTRKTRSCLAVMEFVPNHLLEPPKGLNRETLSSPNVILESSSLDSDTGMVDATNRKRLKLNALNALRWYFINDTAWEPLPDSIKWVYELCVQSSDRLVFLTSLSALASSPSSVDSLVCRILKPLVLKAFTNPKDAAVPELLDVVSQISIRVLPLMWQEGGLKEILETCKVRKLNGKYLPLSLFVWPWLKEEMCQKPLSSEFKGFMRELVSLDLKHKDPTPTKLKSKALECLSLISFEWGS